MMTSGFSPGQSSQTTRPNFDKREVRGSLRTIVRSVLLGNGARRAVDSLPMTHPYPDATISIELEARLRNASAFLTGQNTFPRGLCGKAARGLPSKYGVASPPSCHNLSPQPSCGGGRPTQRGGKKNGSDCSLSRSASCPGLFRDFASGNFGQHFQGDFGSTGINRQLDDSSPMLAGNAAGPGSPAAYRGRGFTQRLGNTLGAAGSDDDRTPCPSRIIAHAPRNSSHSANKSSVRRMRDDSPPCSWCNRRHDRRRQSDR